MRENRSRFAFLRAPRIVLFGGLLVATILFTGCEQRFGMPKSETTQGDSVMSLWLVSMYAAIALGTLVFGLVAYSLIRHRRRSDDLPKQIKGHTGWEVTYTLLPLVAVFALFLFGLKVQDITTALDRNPDLRVTVTAFQWNWRFEYPEQNVTIVGGIQDIHDSSTFPELVMPVGERTRLNLVAADVAHSFFVPSFITKRDLIPGVKNEIDLTPKSPGEFIGHCAEFCGVNHSQMNFKVRVVSREDFDLWVDEQQRLRDAKASTATSLTPISASEAS